MTKMVQLSDEAYARLKAQKRKGESFSDVVSRLTPTGSLRDLAGLMSAQEAEALKRAIAATDARDRPDDALARHVQEQYDERA